MLPVNGARSELDWMGSSRSLIFAKKVKVSMQNCEVWMSCTIVWIYKVLLDLCIVIMFVWVAR